MNLPAVDHDIPGITPDIPDGFSEVLNRSFTGDEKNFMKRMDEHYDTDVKTIVEMRYDLDFMEAVIADIWHKAFLAGQSQGIKIAKEFGK